VRKKWSPSAVNVGAAAEPLLKASAIASVKHVADCGLASDEMRAWLAMMVESPLAS
jgi:hypothetical protein